MGGVALLKVLYDPKRVQIVVEAEAVALEAAVESALPGMTEGRVADVMDKGEGLGKIFVKAEGGGNIAGNLDNLNGVGKAGAEVVGRAGSENLGLAGQTTEGAGLRDTFAIALERGPSRAWWSLVGAGIEREGRFLSDGAALESGAH